MGLNAIRRKRQAKGRWMKLRDHEMLARYMEKHDMSQARLGRYAECSRQFIHMLATGEKNTCTPAVAKRIEEALGLIPGTLFDPKESPNRRHNVAHQSKAKAS